MILCSLIQSFHVWNDEFSVYVFLALNTNRFKLKQVFVEPQKKAIWQLHTVQQWSYKKPVGVVLSYLTYILKSSPWTQWYWEFGWHSACHGVCWPCFMIRRLWFSSNQRGLLWDFIVAMICGSAPDRFKTNYYTHHQETIIYIYCYIAQQSPGSPHAVFDTRLWTLGMKWVEHFGLALWSWENTY